MATYPEYEGSANYPTWAVRQEILNDQEQYNFWLEQVSVMQEAAQNGELDYDAPITPDEAARWSLADLLKQEISEEGPTEIYEKMPSVYQGLLDFALGIVDWTELATELIEKDRENKAYEAEKGAK